MRKGRGSVIGPIIPCADHGVDAGARRGARALLGDDDLPAIGIERGDRVLDGDLHLIAGGVVADQSSVPPGATPDAIRRTISSTEPATCT